MGNTENSGCSSMRVNAAPFTRSCVLVLLATYPPECHLHPAKQDSRNLPDMRPLLRMWLLYLRTRIVALAY